MTATARFGIKAHSEDVSLPSQSLCGLDLHSGLPYFLLKYKYKIKAAAAYAVTLHLPGEEKATLMRLLGLLYSVL